MNKILTFGVYDYLHLGHLRLFKQCKEYGDYLIVAVQNGDYIRKFKPNAKVLYSTDHKGGRFDEVEEWCNQNGKKVVRLKRTPGICSSDIKKSV